MVRLAGGASTNSRAHRPLPPGAVSGRTVFVSGARETVEFTYADGHIERRQLLSWLGGQSGLLWGGGPYPDEIYDAMIPDEDSWAVHGSYGHAAEFALADALGEALDGVFTSDALSCRFFQDGATPLAAAARLARHATGRWDVASCGYHGAAAEWAHAPSDKGILPEDVNSHAHFDWGHTRELRTMAKHCAAICVEVPPCPDDEARAYLQTVRAACDAGGAVFILDEIVTGFRIALSGAAGYYGVKPDIACYGKALSATGCVSAIVGRADLVDAIGGDVFLSTTFGGAPGPASVAAATVKWLTAHHAEVFGANGHLYLIGKALMDGLASAGIETYGQPERSVYKFDTDAQWLSWCSDMINHGIMVHRPNFPSLAHTMADVEKTVEAARQVAKVAV